MLKNLHCSRPKLLWHESRYLGSSYFVRGLKHVSNFLSDTTDKITQSYVYHSNIINKVITLLHDQSFNNFPHLSVYHFLSTDHKTKLTLAAEVCTIVSYNVSFVTWRFWLYQKRVFVLINKPLSEYCCICSAERTII